MLNPEESKGKKGKKEQMEQEENKLQNHRFKPDYINDYSNGCGKQNPFKRAPQDFPP